MKKLFYVLVIVLFNQVFFACSNDDIDEDLQIEQTLKAGDSDWNGLNIDEDDEE